MSETPRSTFHNQGALDAKGITCERVRRAAAQGHALRWYWCVWGMVQRGVAAMVLFALVTPALLLWMPAWWYVKKRERALLAKGPRWNDSVSETKMLVCTFALVFYLASSVATALLLRSPWPALLLVYFYAALRCYEEVSSLAWLRPSGMRVLPLGVEQHNMLDCLG